MNIRQSFIKTAFLSFGVLLFAGTLSFAASTSVSAQTSKDLPLPNTRFPFCPRPSPTTPLPKVALIPTRIQLIEQRDEFSSDVRQKLFISVRNDGRLFFSKSALISATINGTSYTGIIYGSAASQHQLGGRIARCETGGISLRDTFPMGTFQRGQSVKVGVPGDPVFNEATLTIQ